MTATQKELREAWLLGFHAGRGEWSRVPPARILEAATLAYPPKKVQRRREIQCNGRVFRIFNGCLQSRSPMASSREAEWENAFSLVDTRELADLLIRPTEEVEVDE